MDFVHFECEKCGGVFITRNDRCKVEMNCPVCNYKLNALGGTNITNEKKSLLIIELQDEQAVPKVIYKGKEVKAKINISFDWETADSYDLGGLTYAIEHIDTNSKAPTVNRIERRFGSHASN